MSIRLIAKDLYRAIKEVEALENEIENAPYEKREALKFKLRKAKAMEKQLRGMLEVKKDL
jgi:hypothetical protein